MVVKNEFVKIKSGGKEYTLRNYIYDNYLKLFSKYQKQTYRLDGITESVETSLFACMIKVDTPLQDYKNANIYDFDIVIPYTSADITGNENGTSTIYEYSSLLINYMNPIDLHEYDGKKITAIGFCGITRWRDVQPIYELYACLDTDFYSIYIDADEGIQITRKDTIQSEAVCDGADYPLHLAPVLERIEREDLDAGTVRAILYSVGFGSIRGQMDREWIVGQDVFIDTIDDYTYGFLMNNPTSTLLYPSDNLFPFNSIYPGQQGYKENMYPQEERYSSAGAYPMPSNYNFIILKYRLYYNVLDQITYLNEYYTMSYAYSPSGIFILKNKIERGN